MFALNYYMYIIYSLFIYRLRVFFPFFPGMYNLNILSMPDIILIISLYMSLYIIHSVSVSKREADYTRALLFS